MSDELFMRDVMVLWSPTDFHREIHVIQPQIKIVRHSDDNRKWKHLKSFGACYAGWREAIPADLAVHLLSLFAVAVGRDGVPADLAQTEFLQIQEYKQWIDTQTGPFADAHWRWASNAPRSEGEVA